MPDGVAVDVVVVPLVVVLVVVRHDGQGAEPGAETGCVGDDEVVTMMAMYVYSGWLSVKDSR